MLTVVRETVGASATRNSRTTIARCFENTRHREPDDCYVVQRALHIQRRREKRRAGLRISVNHVAWSGSTRRRHHGGTHERRCSSTGDSRSPSLPRGAARRLFYVALTRARQCVYRVATSGRSSGFVTELLRDDCDVTTFGIAPKSAPDCPACVTA